MKLFIVIANYRVADLTIDCIRSVAKELNSVSGMHVGICENGSGDDSYEKIQKAISDNGWQHWCELTAVTPNLGFTGGNNIILRAALESKTPPKYILLLNADTVVRPDAFKKLVDFMDSHSEIGIAGSRLEDPDGTPQRSAFRFHSALGELERGARLGLITRLLRRWVVAPPVPDHACETDWVSGACMIIRQKVFKDIGLLDEGYYTYYEDIDFCFNARKKGWRVWYLPCSRVVHLGGQSTGLTKSNKRYPAYFFMARRRYFLKNCGALYALIADTGLVFGLALWRLRVLFGKPDSTPPYFFRDTIKYSIFRTGTKIYDVENPALKSRPIISSH